MKHFLSVIALSFMMVIMLCLYKLVGCIGEEKLIKVSITDCVCPGDIVTYECTVLGGIGAATIWKSDFFQCSSGKQLIELVHRQLTEGEEFHGRICNDGDTVGRIVRSENHYFTSQLNITLTDNIAGESIECIGDNGTNTHRIGLLNLTTATAIQSPLPPQNISWLISYQQLYKYMIAFQWNTHPPNCHPTYNILASNCGICPTTTNQTTVTCTDVPTDIDDGVCMLAVQTVVCGSFAGEFSPYVSVQVFDDNGSYSSRISPALVSAIILGVALIISLIGFATVTIILFMKTKIKVQTGATTVTLVSRKDENRSDITTNKNVAYVVHSPKQI